MQKVNNACTDDFDMKILDSNQVTKVKADQIIFIHFDLSSLPKVMVKLSNKRKDVNLKLFFSQSMICALHSIYFIDSKLF